MRDARARHTIRRLSVLKRATLRRRVAWTAFVVLLCSVVASLRMYRRNGPRTSPPAACAATASDSVRLVRVATDTIADLRARRQQVSRFTWTLHGVEVRTEDIDPLSAHDGGLAAFDCAGRLTFLWLDGG